MALRAFKTTRFYKELRYIYRSFLYYHHPLSYLYHRFVAGPKLRKFSRALDRPPATDGYSVHTLCNHDGLDLMLWSALSWYQVVEHSGPLYIHEDGTFTPADRELVKKLLPHAKLVERSWAKSQEEQWLDGFPTAREFRKHEQRYIYMLKFIDPYFVSPCPARLVVDIDVLWFEKPEAVLDRLLSKRSPFMIRSHSPMDYRFADGGQLTAEQQMANAGIIGYQKSQYPLARLEEFLRRNGIDNPPRLTDQAGYSYILSASPDFSYLSGDDYTLKSKPHPVARHYTGPRREEFWMEGVKKVNAKIR